MLTVFKGKTQISLDVDRQLDVLHESWQKLVALNDEYKNKLVPLEKQPDTLKMVRYAVSNINKYISNLLEQHPLLVYSQHDTESEKEVKSKYRAYTMFYNSIVTHTRKVFGTKDITLVNIPVLDKTSDASKWFYNRGVLSWASGTIVSKKEFEQFLPEFFYSLVSLLAFVYVPGTNRITFVKLVSQKEGFNKYYDKVTSMLSNKKDSLSANNINKIVNSMQEYISPVNVLQQKDLPIFAETMSFHLSRKVLRLNDLLQKAVSKKHKNNANFYVETVTDYIQNSLELMHEFYKKGQIDFSQLFKADSETVKIFHAVL